MSKAYTEAYTNLYHGTTAERAKCIINSQVFVKSTTGWCGSGVYFYDIKAKAWWSAHRTCRDLKVQTGVSDKPAIVCADITELPRSSIFDLRTVEDLLDFADYAESFLKENDFDIKTDVPQNEDENILKMRAMLISFYCIEKKKKLAVGYFMQNARNDREDVSSVADKWNLVVGVETIYCAKDIAIIRNIRSN